MAKAKPKRNGPARASQGDTASVEMLEREELDGAEDAEMSLGEMPQEAEPRLSVEGAARSRRAPRRGFSFTAPVRFAAHAAFYYAGKTADKAVRLYSKAFKLDQEYIADYSKSTGVAHVKDGRWEKAVPLLERALAITPDDLDIRMSLAEAYAGLHHYEEACEHLEEVLDVNPESARAARALGLICSRREDYEGAIEYLERAMELDPDNAETSYRLGAAYDNTKRYEQAVACFRQAIVLEPRFAKAYQALGFTYESMGDRESAVDCFKKALELD